MSEITDFYLSWQGNAAFGTSGIRVRDQEPLVFKPTDISGCVMWMDANDTNAVNYNDLLQVLSWQNKGTLGGQFDLSGGLVEYGAATQNGLNTVSFNSNAFMSGQFQFNFQARSIFIVTRETGVPAGTPSPWITCDTNNGMETFSQHNGTTVYYIGKHNVVFPELAAESATDYTGYAALFSFVNAADLSDNFVGVNRTPITITYSNIASGYNTNSITYFLGDYLNGTSVGNSQDMCELIIYNTALSAPERENVEFYLMTKWGITEPPPAPPAPFVPTDISGLYIWFDANNLSTITLDKGVEVLAWSNLGLAGGTATTNVGVPVLGPDSNANNNNVMVFGQDTDLQVNLTLPYLDRTQFAVFQATDDIASYSYPYANIFNTLANSGMQTGFTYDVGQDKYFATMCQQGQNCPVIGDLPNNVNAGKYSLCIWTNLASDYTQNQLYFNGGTNINIGSDAGNLFLQTPETYYINNANSNGPPFIQAEILEYDSVLSASNISTVADYLVNKWAISSFTTIS